jgi:diacylglycerol kinase
MSSFRYALKGIRVLVASQPNARIHLMAALVVIFLGLWFDISSQEWLILVGFISLVICLEAVNTAIEYLTDLVSPEYNPLAGKVKDIAAGAVLIAAIGAVVAGVMIFLPKVWKWL